MSKSRKSINYINNKDLHQEMIKFIDGRKAALAAGKQPPQISKYIGQAIMLIADRLARKGNFSGYSFKDEMISDGIENCIMYLHNFNPEKSNNPFAYITLIIWRAYIRRIEKEAKHSYIRHKLMFTNPVLNGTGESMDKSDMDAISSAMESMSNEKSADIIEKFETKLQKKKDKKVAAHDGIEEESDED
jgi:hypothetical protein